MANISTKRGAPDSPADKVRVKKEKLDDEEKEPEAREEDPGVVGADAPTDAEDDSSSEDEAEFVTLISSDGKEVKAEAEILRNESSVFRALLSLSESTIKRQAIKLTDSNIETFDAVAFAVNAVTQKDMKDGDILPKTLTVDVLRFAPKWDLAMIVQRYGDYLKRNTKPTLHESAEAMFTGYPKIAAQRLRSGIEFKFTEGGGPQRDPGAWLHRLESRAGRTADVPEHHLTIPGGKIDDLGCCSYQAFSSLPATFVWAVLRARAIANLNGKGDDWEVIGDEFEKIAAAMYPTDGSNK